MMNECSRRADLGRVSGIFAEGLIALAALPLDTTVMSGRYRRTTSEEEIARHHHIPIPPQLDLLISYNIAARHRMFWRYGTILRPASARSTRCGGV